MLVTDMPWHQPLVMCHKLASLAPTPVQGSAYLPLDLEHVVLRLHRELVEPVHVSVPGDSATKTLVTDFTIVASFVNDLMVLQFLC